ncbi:MAG: T9SS type A sorting domain-containing protein [Bacteroidota bacterium]
MMKRYSYLFLFFFCSFSTLLSQQALLEFPLPTETFDLRTIGQYEDAFFFRHGSPLNYSVWRYLPATNDLLPLTSDDAVLEDELLGEDGFYYAEKAKDQQFELAPIDLYKVGDGNPQRLSTLMAYDLEFLASGEGHILFRARGKVYWLEEATAAISPVADYNDFLEDAVYWQEAFYWTRDGFLYRLGREGGFSILYQSDWWPKGLTAMAGALIWQDSVHLYRYDGEEAPRPFYEFPADDFREINLEGGVLLSGARFVFSAPSSNNGQELWITNGFGPGTGILKDITTGTYSNGSPASSFPAYLHLHDGLIHFLAFDASFQRQYWTTDGTVAGTILREELTVERNWKRISTQQTLASGGYQLIAEGPQNGTEAMIFKGGVRGHDTNPGPGDSFTDDFYLSPVLELSGDRVVVGAMSAQHGEEPFLLTAEGETWPLGDLSPGAAWSEIIWLGEYDERVYLLAGNVDDGYHFYGLDLSQAVSMPDIVNEGIDWVQTIRTAPNFDASSGYMYGTDLEPASDNGFFVGGSITGYSQNLRYAPTAPEELYGDLGMPCFVVKYQEDGQPLWQLGLPGYAYSADRPILATAPEGGVYAASRSNNDGFIRDTPFNPQAGSAFITRLDENGSVNWLRQFSLSNRGYLYDMAADAEGNLLLTGWFENSLSYQGQRIEAALGVAFFALSLDPAGELRFFRALDATENWVSRGGARGLTFDDDGNAYLVLNSISKNYTVSCNFGDMPSTVIKLSPTGETIWRREFLGNDAWYITDLALSSRGNVYLSGKFRGDLEMDGRKLSHKTENCTLTGFLAKMDPSGMIRTARILEDGRRPDQMLTQDDGTYVLTGYRALDSAEDYLGFSHRPFGNRRQEAFMTIYNEQDQILAERTFQLRDEIENGSFAMLLPLEGQQFLLYTELVGPLDTIGATGGLSLLEPSLALAAVRLPYELTGLPTDGTVPRTALSVFPNPTVDFVNLSTSDGDLRPEDMRLYNALGQEVSAPVTIFETGQYQLDLRQLPAGQYWLASEQGDELLSYPIVRVGQR